MRTTVGLVASRTGAAADAQDADRFGAERSPDRVGVLELVSVERLAQASENRLRRLGPDVAREHDLFHLLQDGRVDLFLALKERTQLRDESSARRGEPLAQARDVSLRRRHRRSRRGGAGLRPFGAGGRRSSRRAAPLGGSGRRRRRRLRGGLALLRSIGGSPGRRLRRRAREGPRRRGSLQLAAGLAAARQGHEHDDGEHDERDDDGYGSGHGRRWLGRDGGGL